MLALRVPLRAPAPLRCIHTTAAAWSKASRKPLTGKMGNKQYTKGKRVRGIGRHTKHGAPHSPARICPGVF